MRRTVTALVVALACLVPGGVSAQSAPERATNADLATDAPNEYTVVKGDTLWAISGRFLKEPFKWPLLWQMNREQIKNPHLIYPGDVIRLDRSGAYPELSLVSGGASGLGAGSAVGNVVRLQPRVRLEPLNTAIPSIPGSVIGPFLTQPLVVEAGGLDSNPRIVATEESRVVVGAGNVAYAAKIAAQDGINWQVFRPGIALRDPDTGEVLGYEARYLGDARVRRFGHPSTIEILRTREEINRGDLLSPAREATFPSYVPRAPDKPIRGLIMHVDGGVSELGQYQVISLNRGSRDGVEVGHVLASYRRGQVLNSEGERLGFQGGTEFFSEMRQWWNSNVKPLMPKGEATAAPAPVAGGATGAAGSAAPDDGVLRVPDERNGLVFVFRVFEKMSYGLVVRATSPIYIGDVVQTP